MKNTTLDAQRSSVLAPSTSAGSGSRRWLLLYNCQAQGLTYCLGILGRDLRVDCYEVPTVEANAVAISRMLRTYERVLLLPQVRSIPGFDLAGHSQVRDLPSFVFSGYHPDLFRLKDTAGLCQGPLGNFHSLLAYSGWRLGCDVDSAVALFSEPVFQRLGYMNCWDLEREALLDRFVRVGIDLRLQFYEWSRRGPFMYNPIHPKIALLRDLARKLLDEAGVACRTTDLLPHDNLAAGTVFPVYPPIAARLGVAGGYAFKPQGRYQTFELREFVEKSFGAFESFRAALPAESDSSRVEESLKCLTNILSGEK